MQFLLFSVATLCFLSVGSFGAARGLQCCMDDSCLSRCTAADGMQCFRNKTGMGCGFNETTISYTVGSMGVEWSQVYCNTSLCNRCPFKFQSCPFPTIPETKLACACTPDGMKNTLFDLGYRPNATIRAMLCQKNQCSLEAMAKSLGRLDHMDSTSFHCLVQVEGNLTSYGCDFGIGLDLGKQTRVVTMKTESEWTLRCRDQSLCNKQNNFLDYRRVGEWVVDKRKLLDCPFSESLFNPRTCSPPEPLAQLHSQTAPNSHLSPSILFLSAIHIGLTLFERRYSNMLQ